MMIGDLGGNLSVKFGDNLAEKFSCDLAIKFSYDYWAIQWEI